MIGPQVKESAQSSIPRNAVAGNAIAGSAAEWCAFVWNFTMGYWYMSLYHQYEIKIFPVAIVLGVGFVTFLLQIILFKTYRTVKIMEDGKIDEEEKEWLEEIEEIEPESGGVFMSFLTIQTIRS